ncbi:MAG: hypothetical protein WCC87_12265 [Candidatus Korobacteraceae bacterium]
MTNLLFGDGVSFFDHPDFASSPCGRNEDANATPLAVFGEIIQQRTDTKVS